MRLSENTKTLFAFILGNQEKAERLSSLIIKINKDFDTRIKFEAIKLNPMLEATAFDNSMDMISGIDEIISYISNMYIMLEDKIVSLEKIKSATEIKVINTINDSEFFIQIKSQGNKDVYKKEKLNEALAEMEIAIDELKRKKQLLGLLIDDATRDREKINRYHDGIKKIMGQLNAFRD